MEISKNHWTARLYRMTYGTESELPKTICPYFWKLVLAILLFIICQPLLLPTGVFKTYRDDIKQYGYISKYHDHLTIGVGFCMYIFMFWISIVLIGMVAIWIPNHDKTFDVPGMLGYCFLFVFLVFLTVTGIIAFSDKRSEKRNAEITRLIEEEGYDVYLKSKYNKNRLKIKVKKEKKPNILLEYMRGLIGKYCTRIDWK